jgi:hypothetical protein
VGVDSDRALHPWRPVIFSEIPWVEFDSTDPEEWSRLYEVFLEFSLNPVVFLDEIQELSDFSGGLRYLVNRGCRVFITGTNTNVSERNLPTVLRGKVLVYRLFPRRIGSTVADQDTSELHKT